MLAALLEAAIAALFLEHGYEPIERAIVAAFADRIEYALHDARRPQDRAPGGAREVGPQVTYTVLDVEGPPHERRFSCAAQIDGEELGTGAGRSKKEAEQAAAKQALPRSAAAPA